MTILLLLKARNFKITNIFNYTVIFVLEDDCIVKNVGNCIQSFSPLIVISLLVNVMLNANFDF